MDEMKKGFKQCFCQSNNCSGRFVAPSTLQRHSKQDYQMLKTSRKRSLERLPQYEGRIKFDEALYETSEVAKTKLFSGSKLSVLAAIFIKFRTFVSHPFSTKEELCELFRCDKNLNLPEGNNMPGSYSEARKLIEPFLCPLEKFHCCINDCMVFRKENLDLESCTFCGEGRFEGNKPRRTFTYFPLGPRIARMVGSPAMMALIKGEAVNDDEWIRDIQDTVTWKGEWFSEDGLFKGRIGIGVSFCTDGMNPLRSNNKQYSMWPLMIQILNFPPAFRKSFAGIQVLGIVPGNGTKEPYSLEPYLQVFVDEMQRLSHCTFYIKTEEKEIQVKLVQFIFDFPAIAKVMHTQAQGGLRACCWCKLKGEHCNLCSKTKYLGSRKFLDSNSPLRQSTSFPGGGMENGDPYEPLTKEEHLKLREEYEKKPNKTQKAKFLKENGVKGNYAFMQLPYHGFNKDYQPDGMHTVRRVVSCIIHWLSQQMQKTPFEKVMASERILRGDGFHEDVMYILSAEDIKLGNDRVSLLNFPPECTGYKGDVFTNSGKVLKNHHGWQEYTVDNVWVFALRDCLPQRKQRTFTYFFAVLSHLFAKKYTPYQLDQLEGHVHQSLALLERDFPSVVFNITTHICHHFVGNMKRFGPLYSSWMYPLERMNSWITRRCNQKAAMESCVMETYQLFDWIVYCSLSNKFPEAEDPGNLICRKTLFAYGEITQLTRKDQLNSKRKRAVIVEFDEAEIKHLNMYLQLDEPIESAISIEKVELESEFGEKFVLMLGSFCRFEEKIGKVNTIFKSFINGNDEIFVKIDVFDLKCDNETGLYYVHTDTGTDHRFVHPSTLGQPSVHAVEENKVWILSEKPCLEFPWLAAHLAF